MIETKQTKQPINKFRNQTAILATAGNLLARCFSLYCLLMAVFLGVQDSLLIDWWGDREVALICIGTAAVVTMFYYVKKLTILGILAGIILEIYFVKVQFPFLLQEFFKCFYHTIPLVNNYYRTSFPVKEVVASENPMIFLGFIAIFLGMLFGIGVAFGKKHLWSFFLLVPAFVGGFFLGYAPGMQTILYLLGGLGGTLLTFSKKASGAEKSAGRFAFLVLCMVVGIAAFVYKPMSEKLMVYHESWDNFQTKLEDKMLAVVNNSDAFLDWFWRVGGREERARLTNEAPRLSKEEIFTITVEQCPKEAIYVKDFVGVFYDKGVWYPEEKWGFPEYLDNQQTEPLIQEIQGLEVDEKARYIQEKGFEFSSQLGNRVENVKILTKIRTGNLSLQLYGAAIPEDAAIVGDSGIRMNEKAYEFQRIYQGGAIVLNNFYGPSYITDYFDYKSLDYNSWDFFENTNGKDAKGELLDAYAAYVRDTYTQVPTEQLENIINNWVLANDNLLQECTYSFDLAPVPEGKDVVEYFVLEQKKGYCMHFASSHALMLRMTGIPTRYVGGYLVPPKDFQENEDGTYTAVVTGQRAHAWIEYYDGYYGWTAYETTPAAYYTGMMNVGDGSVANLVHNLELWAESNGIFQNESTQEEVPEDEKEIDKDKELPEQENVKKEPQQTENEEKENKGPNPTPGGAGTTAHKDSIFGQVFKKVLLIAGLIAGLLATILLRRRIVWKKRKKIFTGTDTRKAAECMVKETLRLLELTKIRLDQQQKELDFARETESVVECLKEGEFVEFIEIARIARYSNAEITEGQIRYLHMIYKKLMRYQAERLNWYQRIWYQYGQIRLE